MNCGEFDEIVHELDRSSQRVATGIQAPESEAALAHAESCSRCAKLLTEVEALNFGLRDIAKHDAVRKAPPRLEESLLHAFREQAAKQPATAIPHGTPGRLKIYGWYAAALGAAAVVLFALGAVRGWIGTGVREPAPNPVGTVAETPASTKKPLVIGHQVVSAGSHTSTGASVEAVPASQVAASEDATAFYALPYADDTTSLDGGAVIRVSVPRSALVAWGLPVSGMGEAGPVPADLVVSPDGTPEAIRLVSQSSK